MPYLILDPVNEYAAYQKVFLDRLGLEAVALFSSPAHHGIWCHRWKNELGSLVVGEHIVDRENLAGLASDLKEDFPEGLFGLVAWDERHILLAAEICEELELEWNSRAVIERCRDKSLLKKWVRETSDVRLNRAAVVENAEQATAFQHEVGSWPIVVKPSGGAGSMSVHFAHDDGELLGGCQRVLESGLGEVLLEEYIGGVEYAVNGVSDHEGHVLITDIWRYDKRDSHGEKNLYYESIKLGSHEEPFAAIIAYAADVIAAVGLCRSPFHMEVKVDDVGPCLIEVGARFAGGEQPVLASKLHSRSLFELAACHYLDDIPVGPHDVNYERYDRLSARILSGIQTVQIPQIREVLGLDEVRALPSFAGIGIMRKPGRPAPLSRDINTKAWEVYLLHPDHEQVISDSQAVRDLLRYV